MARSRNIKPGFFTNDDLAEVNPLGRLLFIGLWCHADREGRLNDRPKKIKAEIIPYDDFDVDEALTRLHELKFITRYEVGGCSFIQINNFLKHQNPHTKEQASDIPEMQEQDLHGACTVQEPNKTGSCPADSLNLIPDSLTLIPDSIDNRPMPTAKVVNKDYPEDFEETWSAYPKRPGASKKDAYKAWSARIKDGVDPEAIIAGVRRYSAYCDKSVTDATFIKQPATFFGPGEHYLSDWTVHSRPSQNGNSQYHQSITAAGKAIFGDISNGGSREIIDITPTSRKLGG